MNRKTGKQIKALIVIHTFGHPADLAALSDICSRFHISMIEDAAEAIGSYYQGKHVGHWGELTVLSFNGNKTITTGGGGAVLTNDEALGKLLKHLSTTAKITHPWDYRHDQIGYNYRLPNLNAALGCAQLEILPKLLERKRALAKRYAEAFDGIRGIHFFKEPTFAKSNYWLNALLFDHSAVSQRDAFLKLTHEHRIMTRPVWILMHQMPMYSKCPRMDLTIAEALAKRIVNIPSSPNL